MKRLAALTLAILLALALAAPALADTYAAGQYFTVDYPDDLTLDDATYTGDTTNDYIWLFMLYNDQHVIDASLSPATGYENVSLYEATQEERDAYLADMLDAYADSNAVFVDTLTTVSGFPFYIYTMDDGDGAYYYAQTIINGTSVDLCAYYQDVETAPDQALLDKLAEVLITLRPVDEADAAQGA